ncbi:MULTISPECIES: MbeD family mobilization/exclusion protein [unclassified Pantoea]|uniref:MbeD family mobilization/exclusion protein n=1 Tax=unclassified Pantoea TaxID=2630326 RepID=UPI000D8CD1D7|nr:MULTISPECIES: MbeD family mobilization/exclusion protein [unclassified Pantoea]MBD9646682.1 MbeD family mobilization/exclusion protein [Pantoea sp. PNT02]MDR6348637.1 hypothetical protein [Pantoea sp. SORGH_AS_0659]PYG48011.1 MbeD/MobD like protein [Pantoea sp. AG1095]WFL67282.1 MbeD family mobilization/exclusion protein [Pantoea sp. X85]
MTKLEKQLLSALKQLQQDYSLRMREWDAALGELQTMFGTTQRMLCSIHPRGCLI